MFPTEELPTVQFLVSVTCRQCRGHKRIRHPYWAAVAECQRVGLEPTTYLQAKTPEGLEYSPNEVECPTCAGTGVEDTGLPLLDLFPWKLPTEGSLSLATDRCIQQWNLTVGLALVIYEVLTPAQRTQVHERLVELGAIAEDYKIKGEKLAELDIPIDCCQHEE